MTRNSEQKIAMLWAGELDPLDLDGYRRRGGFTAFVKAKAMEPAALVSMVDASGLRGRGGAGFPTGMKWKFAAAEPGSGKHAIANADEGEPGTFKDRYIMEQVPYRFLEGLMIASLAIGASDAWIYIRHEYTRSIEVLKAAIEQLYLAGLAGNDGGGQGRRLDIHLRTGAGSYLCGDETTLLESMEGKRGNPRYKPPFPAQKGFRGKPSVVNNVETLAHVPYIILHGAEAYRAVGTPQSPGTKMYCLSGTVNQPGVYELPMGTTLRTLIDDFGGGMPEGVALKGALLGGAAGTFTDTTLLDVPMDYDQLKAVGATLGSGAVIVIGDKDPVPMMLENILHFFKHESCGKCVPCRIGCHRLIRMMDDLGTGAIPKADTMGMMIREAGLMASTSLCGLGQSPILPVRSAFRYFSNEF
ncbi:MAG: NADH-ubiquinone oxidoreductase-F iron-sulfur binding region domain-containing protein [Bacteroidales bacterium]